MESDNNPFPEFKLFDPVERLKKIGRFMFGLQEAPAYMSEHYPGHDEWQRLLDESKPTVDRFEQLAFEQYDSEGAYITVREA